MTPRKIDFASLITGGVTAGSSGALQNLAWQRPNGAAISAGITALGAVLMAEGGLPTNGAALYHSGLSVLAFNLTPDFFGGANV